MTQFCAVGCPNFFILNGEHRLYSFPSKEIDGKRRKKWLDYFDMEEPNTECVFACSRHFSTNQICGVIMNNDGVPDIPVFNNIPGPFKKKPKNWSSNVIVVTPRDPEFILYKNNTGVFSQDQFQYGNSLQLPIMTNSIQLPILPSNPIMIPSIKSVACSVSTQTNTRLCGLVEISEFLDEYRLNCFYCCNSFPLEKWFEFRDHMKQQHFKEEQAFKSIKYSYGDHDYTKVVSRPTSPVPTKSVPVLQQPKPVNSKDKPFDIDMATTLMKLLDDTLLNPNFRLTEEDNIMVIKTNNKNNMKTTESVLNKIVATNTLAAPENLRRKTINISHTSSPNNHNEPVSNTETKTTFSTTARHSTGSRKVFTSQSCPAFDSTDAAAHKLSKPCVKRITFKNKSAELTVNRVVQQTLKNITEFETLYKDIKTKPARTATSGVFIVKDFAQNTDIKKYISNKTTLNRLDTKTNARLSETAQTPSKAYPKRSHFEISDPLSKDAKAETARSLSKEFPKRVQLDESDPLYEAHQTGIHNQTKKVLYRSTPLNRCLKRQPSKECSKSTHIDISDHLSEAPQAKIENQTQKVLYRRTPLNRCLKRSNTETNDPLFEIPQTNLKRSLNNSTVAKDPLSGKLQEQEELCFRVTAPEIMMDLLETLKNYPILWKFHNEAKNENYTKAILEVCEKINDKWCLNVASLQMRRSVNRILAFYRFMLPCKKVEKFANFYEKCLEFLPKSVDDIPRKRCEYCDKCFTKDTDFITHLVEEHQISNWHYKCNHCSECFLTKNECEFHKILPHYMEIFNCSQCNKKFDHLHLLTKHVKIHELEKNECVTCDMKFENKTDLYKHNSIHRKSRFKCHLCPKSFEKKSVIEEHIKKHNQQFDFICEICGKGFLRMTALNTHMEVHTGAKITCKICNIKLRRCSLSRHLRLCHLACEGTIESAYRRQHYHYKKRSNSSAKYRPIVFNRTKEKAPRKYDCKKCNIPFDELKWLKEHNKKMHLNVQTHKCKICNYGFRRKGNLRYHYRDVHKLHYVQIVKILDFKEDMDEVLKLTREECIKLAEDNENSKDEVDDSNSIKNETTKAEENEDKIFNNNNMRDKIIEVAENLDNQGTHIEQISINRIDEQDTEYINYRNRIQDEIMEAVENLEGNLDHSENDFFKTLLEEE